LPDFCLPAAAELPGVVEEHSSLLQQYKRRRQSFFRQSTQEVLVSIFEGTCERVFGRTFALQAYPEYRDFFRRLAVPWRPTFHSALPESAAPASPVSTPSLPGDGSSPVPASLGCSPSSERQRAPSESPLPSVSRTGRALRPPRCFGSPSVPPGQRAVPSASPPRPARRRRRARAPPSALHLSSRAPDVPGPLSSRGLSNQRASRPRR
jgi:hypothetical protein